MHNDIDLQLKGSLTLPFNCFIHYYPPYKKVDFFIVFLQEPKSQMILTHIFRSFREHNKVL